MTSFYFKAVASDGKVRTGTLTAESDKRVAVELRRQGLTPVYVGVQQQKKALEIKLPSFGGGKRRGVLFFTQEMSTLLNAGVPVDRSLAICGELTEKPAFRYIVLDVLRVLKGGKSLADSLGTHPAYFSDLYINMVRAGEASGSLALVFERLSEFERTRDDLRGHTFISYVDDLLFSKELQYLDELHKPDTFALRSTSILAQHAAVAAGAGIAVLPAFIAERDASLAPVLPKQAHFTRTFWMSMPAETKHLGRMQAVWGFVRETVEAQRSVLQGPA